MNAKHILSFASVSLGLSSVACAVTVSLDFESLNPGESALTSPWQFLNTGLGSGGTFVTTAASGGVAANGSSINSGLGGIIAVGNATHSGRLPYSMLVNSLSPVGFDVNQNISGSYDFKYTAQSAYDSSAFLFGDLKAGTISGSNAGQLLEFYHSRGGYGNAPPAFVDGTGANVSSGGSNFNSTNTWYRVSFAWTADGSGNTGDLTMTSTRWNGSSFVAHGSYTQTNYTFDSNEAYFAFTDIYGTNTTFDNISITGEVIPEISHVALSLIGVTALLIRRRR